MSKEKKASPEWDAHKWFERYKSGHPHAVQELVEALNPRLLRMAWRLMGRRQDAEDLVQDTYARLLPALPKFRGEARIDTFAFQILSNCFRNQLRKQSRSPLVRWFGGSASNDDHQEPWEPASTDPIADDLLQTKDQAQQIQALVLKLPPEKRLILLLREVELLSYEEIAELLKLPIGTVRSRIARAREALRRLWSPS